MASLASTARKTTMPRTEPREEKLPKEIAHLIERLKDEKAKAGAASVLTRIAETSEGRNAVLPPLVESLKDEKARERAALVLTIIAKTDEGIKAVLEVKEAVPLLIECLKDWRGGWSAEVVLVAIARTDEGRKAILPLLIECLKDERAREGAASALGHIAYIDEGRKAILKVKEAVPLLVECLKDERTSEHAALVLCYIAQTDEGIKAVLEVKEAVPLLVECLKDEKARAGTVSALTSIAKTDEGRKAVLEVKEAVPLLVESLKDERARMGAVSALGSIAPTKESLMAIGEESFRLVVKSFQDVYPETRRFKEEILLEYLHMIFEITGTLQSTKTLAPFLTSPVVISAFSEHLKTFKELKSPEEKKLSTYFQLAFFPAYLAGHYIGVDFEKHLLNLFKCKTRGEHEGWLKEELAPYLKEKLKARGIDVGDDWHDVLTRAVILPALKLEYYLNEEGEFRKVKRVMEQLGVSRDDLRDFILGLSYAYYFRTMPGGFIEDIPKGCHGRHEEVWHLTTGWYLGGTCRGSLFALPSEIGHFSGDLMGKAFGKRIKMVELEDLITLNGDKTYSPTAQKAIDFAYHIYALGRSMVEHEMGDAEVKKTVMELVRQIKPSEELAELTPSELYSIGRNLMGRFTPTNVETKEHADAAAHLLKGLSQIGIDTVVGTTMWTSGRIASAEIIRPRPYESVVHRSSTHAIAERLSMDVAVKTAVLAYENSLTASLLPHLYEHMKAHLIQNAKLKDGFDYRGVLEALDRLGVDDVRSWCGGMISDGLFDLGKSIEKEKIRCQEIRNKLEELFPIAKTESIIAPRLIEATAVHLMYEKHGLETDLERVHTALKEFNPRSERIEDVERRYVAAKKD